MTDINEDEAARAWGISEDRMIAESEALRMWPPTLHLGKFDGILPKGEIDRRLLVQRDAYTMGERAAFVRSLGGDR